MRSLFDAALNQSPNTLIDSDIITLSGIGTNVPLTITSGTVFKNGVSFAGGTVSDGDTISIRVRSSTLYATPAFGIIKIGAEETVFSVVTLPDPVPVPVTGGDTVLPFDVTKYPDGREYIPSQANNEVSVYSGGALVTKTPLVAPQVNTNKTTDAIAIANYYGNNVFFLNSSYAMLASINTGTNSKPYGIAVTQTTLFDDDALTWITLSGLNQVKVLNKNYATVATYNVGGRPMGIASSVDRRHVYVANYASGTVTHFRYVNGSWTQTNVNVGNKPFEIVVDANNDAWVTCVDDRVYRITDTNVVTSYAVAGTTGLRGIALDGDGMVWVAGSKSNTIAKINLSGALQLTVSTNIYPYALNTAADGSIQVATFGTSQVYSYATDGTPIDLVDVDKMPYGLATYGSDMLVANLYANTPDYAIAKDQTPEQFSLNDPNMIPKGLPYQSSEITVTGLNVPTTAAVPDVFGAKLVKNGNVIGGSTTVSDGDTLRIQFTAPTTYATTISVPLFVGNVFDAVETKTESEDRTPDAFTFEPVPDAVPETDYLSNEITIAGITGGDTTIPFWIDVGIIVLNGVEQAIKTINVKLGDKIRLKLRSSSTDHETLYVTAQAGIVDQTTQVVKSIWRVTTKAVVQELWIKPEHKGLDQFEPSYPQNIAAAGRYITKINFGNSITSIPISNSIEAHIDNALLIPSYYDGAVYQLNAGAFKLLDKFPLDSNKKPVDIAANRFIAYTGVNNRVMDVTNGFTTTIPATPRKIIYDEASDTIYVSMANASIAQLRQVNGHYEIVRTFSVPTSAPYAMALDANGILWFSDVKNQIVRSIDVAGSVSSIATGIAGGQGIWDMALDGRTLWTANSYDNTISKIDLDTKEVVTIKAGWVPTQIEVDTNGFVWVGHYASKNVLKFDPNSNTQVFEAKMQYASPTYMAKFDGHIYVTELYADIVQMQDKVSTLKPLIVHFKDALDALTDEHVKSEIVTVQGLIRPTLAFIEPDNGYELIVNGVKVPSGQKVIDNGDKVQLEVVAPHEAYTEKLSTLNDFQSVNTFLVRTESDTKPDLVTFADLYGAIPQVDVESQQALITGMAPGHTTTLHVKRFGWKVTVNGGEPLDEVIVQNGDIITLFGPSRASYTNPDTLDSKSSYPLIAGRHDYLLGTWTVHGRDIIGGMVINLNKRHDGPVVAFDLRRHDNPSWGFGVAPEWDSKTSVAHVIVDAPVEFEARERSAVESINLLETELRPRTIKHEVQMLAEVGGKSHVEVETSYERRDANASVFEIEAVYEARTKSFIDIEREFDVATHSFKFFERAFDVATRLFTDVQPVFELYALSHKEDLPAEYEVPTRSYLDVAPTYEIAGRSNSVNAEEVKFSLRGFGMVESEIVLSEVRTGSVVEIEAPTATLLKTTYALSSSAVYELMSRTTFSIETLVEKRPYIVHEYSFFEPAFVEGAWDTPQEAVADGIAHGYPKAFAVEMRPNRFVWATPIEDGDMCGLPIPEDNLTQRNARGYVQGG